MPPSFSMADDTEISKRLDLYNEFLRVTIDEEEYPFFVSDEACIYDITTTENAVIIKNCKEHYNVELRAEHFLMPLWRVLDILNPRKMGI